MQLGRKLLTLRVASTWRRQAKLSHWHRAAADRFKKQAQDLAVLASMAASAYLSQQGNEVWQSIIPGPAAHQLTPAVSKIVSCPGSSLNGNCTGSPPESGTQ